MVMFATGAAFNRCYSAAEVETRWLFQLFELSLVRNYDVSSSTIAFLQEKCNLD